MVFLAAIGPGGDDDRARKWEMLKAAGVSWFHIVGPGGLCTMIDLWGPCSLEQLQPMSTLLLSSRGGCSCLAPNVRPCSAQLGNH